MGSRSRPYNLVQMRSIDGSIIEGVLGERIVCHRFDVCVVGGGLSGFFCFLYHKLKQKKQNKTNINVSEFGMTNM